MGRPTPFVRISIRPVIYKFSLSYSVANIQSSSNKKLKKNICV